MTSITLVDLLLLSCSLAAFAACVAIGKRLRSLRLAQWMVSEGQYQRAPEVLIEEMVEYARERGAERAALAHLRLVRQAHGHDSVRHGHLLWIMQRVHAGLSAEDVDDVPSFRAPARP